MRKIKLLSLIVIAILSSIIFIGCSCKKEVAPKGLILYTQSEETPIFIGDTFVIGYEIYPQNSTNTSVAINSNNTNVLDVSETHRNAATGSITVTAKAAGVATITVSVNGTDLRKTFTGRVYEDPERLIAPANLHYDDLTKSLVFTSVTTLVNEVEQGVQRYTLRINNETTIITDPNYNNLTPHAISFSVFGAQTTYQLDREYTASVRAIGDNIHNLDSEFSSEITFLKLSTPTNVATQNGVVTWEHNPLFDHGYVSYLVTLNGEEQELQQENSFTINITEASDYVVTVQTVVNIEELTTVFNSEVSEEITVKKLASAVGLTLSNEVIANGQHLNSLFTWSENVDAESYEITVTPGFNSESSSVITVAKTDLRRISIDSRFLPNVEYTLSVVIKGNGSSKLDAEATIYKFTKLEAVSNLAVNNNELTFDVLSAYTQVNYEVLLVRGSTTVVRMITGGILNVTDIATQAGNYKAYVRSVATHDTVGGKNYANSELTVAEVNFVKLQNPTVNKVDEAGKVYWTLVENTTAYDIYYDDERIVRLDVLDGGLQGAQEGIYDLTQTLSIVAGGHTVSVVAVGEGSYISSNEAVRSEFPFTKLSKIANFTVLNDVVSWQAVAGISQYALAFNSSTYSFIGSTPSYAIASALEENILRIIAVGNNVNVVSSDVAVFTINKLLAPQNLRTVNGVFYFNVDENNDYRVYVGSDTVGVKVTGGTYNFANNIIPGQVVQISVRAFPKTTVEGNTYLSSNASSAQVYKLTAPLNVTSIRNVGEETYRLEWDSVPNTANYKVAIEPINISDTNGMDTVFYVSNNKLDIPVSWVKGLYEIKVYALGNSASLSELIGYLNSDASVTYDVVKLASPTNVRVTNGILYWQAALNPNGATPVEYEVRVVDESLNVLTYRTTNTNFSLQNFGGSYTVSVRAIGNASQNMTSDYSISNTVTKLNPITNLRVDNGVIKWDNNLNGAISVVYDIYLTTNESQTREKIAENYTLTSFILNVEVTKGVEHKIEIIVKATDYLSSEISEPLYFIKLNNIENFEIIAGYFNWLAQDNASAYEIINTTGGGQVVYATVSGHVTTIPFNADAQLGEGTYTFKIRAVGGQNENGNFLTGDFGTTVTITILSKVSNLRVEDGILKWTLNYTAEDENNTPVHYEIFIYKFTGETLGDADVYVTANSSTSFDLNFLSSGDYKIEVVSVGNNTTKISSQPQVLELITKINATTLNLRTNKGVIIWDEFVSDNVEYEMFLDGNSLGKTTTTSYIPQNLIPMQPYAFKILVYADGFITSAYSNELTLVKLPLVSNFKINKNVNPLLPHFLSWNLSMNGGQEIAEGYEIIPQTQNPDLNASAPKSVSQLNFEYNVAGIYELKIRAIGSTNNEGISYISSDYSLPITVTVLDSVKNLIIADNALKYAPSPMYVSDVTRPDSFRILVYSVLPNGDKVLAIDPVVNSGGIYTYNFADVPAGTYYVEVISVGLQSFKVNSKAATLENVVVLAAPNNLKATDGFIDFALSEIEGVDVSYQIFVNGALRLTIENNTKPETQKINAALTGANNEIKIKAVATNAIHSVFSEHIVATKLGAVTNPEIKFINGKSILRWSDVENAHAYGIILPAELSDYFTLEYYNDTTQFYKISVSGAVGFEIPGILQEGSYSFKMIAVGNTTNAGSGDVAYLHSVESQSEISFQVIGSVQNLRVESGIIKWSQLTGAVSYVLEFYDVEDITILTTPYFTRTVSALEFDINIPSFEAGTYTLRVRALGDGVNYLSSLSYEELVIIRGEALNNFHILDGYLAWVLTPSIITTYAYGNPSGTLTPEDITLLENIFKGNTQGVSEALIKNLWPLFNIEFTVSGVKVFTSFPTSVRQHTGEFTLLYNLNISEGEYIITARGLGNTPAHATNEGLNLSGAPDDLEAFNYSHSVYTAAITAYKLANPVTPVHGQTGVYNNKLYWTIVTTPSSATISDYYVIATQKESLTAQITALVTVPEGTTGSIDVRDIEDVVSLAKIPAGYAYSLIVIARGTPNSTLSSGPYYLTSSYKNASEVEILTEPQQLNILDGQIAFALNGKADKHILKIWNNGINFETSTHNPTYDNISLAIEITSDSFVPDSPLYNPFLKLVNGVVFYNLEDNLDIPAYADKTYKVSVIAIGDGVTRINSSERANIEIFKWGSVKLSSSEHAVNIQSGAFMWTHVSVINPYDLTTMRPTHYKVIIQKQSTVPDEGVEVITYYYEVKPSDGTYIYFELPDEDGYDAYKIHNGTAYYYIYSVKVSAYGSVAGGSGIKFATGNSSNSRAGERLSTTTNITTVDGVVVWNAVQHASGYDIYISEMLLQGYEIINNGNTISFEFNQTFAAGTYNLKVKARSSTPQYLSGRTSEYIKVIKLDTPYLRIDNGDIRWNNTDLPAAISTATIFEISGPEGFNPNDIENFSDIVFELDGQIYKAVLLPTHIANTGAGLTLKGNPVGSYMIRVKYIGSTGSVVSENDEYFLVNSDSIAFDFIKIEAPYIELKTETVEDIRNYIEWQKVPYATNYNVVVTKYDGDEAVKQVKFSLGADAGYFTDTGSHLQFDLKAVAQYDINNPTQIQFGDNYSVYVEAYGSNSVAGTPAARFSVSDNSNVEHVAIPATPTNLTLNEYGTITWVNQSVNTAPVLEISYYINGEYTEPSLVELPIGTTSYKLQVISDSYKLRIQSINGTLENLLAQSPFSNIVEGGFNLFNSGAGTADNPYIITTAKHLFNINYYPSSHFKLNNNLNTGIFAELSEWKPIGVASVVYNIPTSVFSGTLDGNGYTVNTITYSNTIRDDLAFIHTISASGVVKNLTLNINAVNLDVKEFGGIAVHNYGTIQNVTVTGGVHVRQNRSDIFVGGVATYNYANAQIIKAVNNATLTSNINSTTNTTSIGGIVYSNAGTIVQAGNNATITGTSMGGIAYINSHAISQSYNKGTLNSVANVGYLRTIAVGGIVGRNEGSATVTYSYVLAFEKINITNNSNSTAYVGGLIGNNGSSANIGYSFVVFKEGNFTGSGTIVSGAITGASTYYLNNYVNIYYQNIGTTLYPIGNQGSVINGITMETESAMKQTSFVDNINSLMFNTNVNNYPTLAWES